MECVRWLDHVINLPSASWTVSEHWCSVPSCRVSVRILHWTLVNTALVFPFSQCTPFYSRTEIGQLALLLFELCQRQQLVKKSFIMTKLSYTQPQFSKWGCSSKINTQWKFYELREVGMPTKSVCLSLLHILTERAFLFFKGMATVTNWPLCVHYGITLWAYLSQTHRLNLRTLWP